jgi:hypothetical protein
VTAFLTQCCSNKHVRYLAVAEYGVGGWKGFIVVPDERSITLNLRSVLHFLHLICGSGSRPQSAVVQRGGHLSHGLDGSVSVQYLKPLVKVVGNRSYAEVPAGANHPTTPLRRQVFSEILFR